MKNISNLFKIRYFSFVMASLLLSCNAKENQQVSSEAEGEDTEPSNELVITQKQFETSAMHLGKFQEYSFGFVIKINGTIDVPPEGRVEISNYYGGYVRNLALLTGQHVKKGEVLFSLENPEYVEMQQDFLEAESQLLYLKSDYERQQTLREENIASQKNLLKAESDYHTTLAKVEGLKKKLELLNINAASVNPGNLISQLAIRAPFSGYVTAVNTLNGAFLSPSDVALSLINTDHIHIDLKVFEKNIASLKEGQSIRFRLPDDRKASFEAEVFMIGKAIEADNRMINVHAHLKDETQNGLFTPGMYVEAEIQSSDKQSMALPSEAVIEVANQYFVLVLVERREGEMVFAKKEVKPGDTANALVEITNASEFKESDEILVKGAFNLIM